MANLLYSISGIILAIGAILTLLGTIGGIWSNGIREKYADERIASNQKEASIANEKAAQAHMSISEANRELEQAKLRAAELENKTAQAELELQKLKDKTSSMRELPDGRLAVGDIVVDGNPRKKIDLLQKCVDSYNTANLSNTIFYAEQYINIDNEMKKASFKMGLEANTRSQDASIYSIYAQALMVQGNLDKALQYANKAVRGDDTLENNISKAMVLIEKADASSSKKDFSAKELSKLIQKYREAPDNQRNTFFKRLIETGYIAPITFDGKGFDVLREFLDMPEAEFKTPSALRVNLPLTNGIAHESFYFRSRPFNSRKLIPYESYSPE